MARAGCPIFVLPMPQMGTTGPMSVLGTSILNMAELLSAVVLFQLAAPGLRHGVGRRLGGRRDAQRALPLAARPRMASSTSVCIEMSRFYGLRTQGSAVSCDAKACDLQAGAEGMLTGHGQRAGRRRRHARLRPHGQRPDGQPRQDGAGRRHGERDRALHARGPGGRGAERSSTTSSRSASAGTSWRAGARGGCTAPASSGSRSCGTAGPFDQYVGTPLVKDAWDRAHDADRGERRAAAAGGRAAARARQRHRRLRQGAAD